MKYFSDPDREVRKKAAQAYADFFEKNDKELGEIFDRLVKIRHQMGENMGFKNFIPLGYMQQGRMDYDEQDVAAFRAQVLKELVPFCEKLYKAQAKRIGVDKIRFYDEQLIFLGGNAVPIGDSAYLVSQAQKMYRDMSKETGEFIDFMIEHELMDLDNKPNKAATGYMTALNDYQAPFVYSCFNGTTGDVDVLTHEMGHAFAGYMAMKTQPFIVMRKRIFAHLVGFLVIENGVFLFSMAIGVELPILINLAIMLDILISILILGMFLRRMDNDIHTDETDALTSIKD